MKILFLIIFFLTSSIARENPFVPLYDTPKMGEDVIPLLHISTNKIFSTQKEPKSVLNASVIATSDLNKTSIKVSSEKNATTQTATDLNKTKIAKPTTIKKKKPKVKKRKYKTIYQNYFLTVQTNYKSFKIFTKDPLLKKVRYSNPSRMTFDFDRLQHFHTKNITLNKPFAKQIKLGSHHEFYRVTVVLNRYKRYKLTKKPYGYLLTFY